MAEKSDHFMMEFKGPAKQFVALVGDVGGAIRYELNKKMKKINDEKDSYYLETYYYSAKYGLKTFSALRDVTREFDAHNTSLMCMFVGYKSIDHLKDAKKVADAIKADTRVVVIDSLELCPEAEKVEEFASKNEFEVVYLHPNQQQRLDAESVSEKVGVDRLIETMEVCNWPWRVVNAFSRGPRSSFIDKQEGDILELNVKEDYVIEGATADSLMRNYKQWFNRTSDARIPAPQHAERVHLSPDSPTTTEGTTNPDDVSISVDIDLVCTKNQEEKKSCEGKAKKQKSASAKHVKKD
ncbi:hypothetical protein CRE_01238 [Caenorhabditis remanei]|uniref:Uncharacterized protein n=2 Tax=Caenorhabditis TaxID=6237 RepID=E3N4R3_CAERE|nr:hypothetical protein CRE_01238 [Caenorhabditis remanei]